VQSGFCGTDADKGQKGNGIFRASQMRINSAG